MKKRKEKTGHKIGSFALTAMLLLSVFAVFPVPAAASGGEIVSIGSASDVASGSTITIPISIANVTEITGLSANLVYDISVVTVVSITANNSVFTSSVTPGGPEGNKAIALTNGDPDYITTTEDTPIIDVTFNVIGTPGSSTTLDLQNVMLSDSSFGTPFPPETVNDGEVTVAGAPPKVVINEFEQNPQGTDSGNEWVELYNNGSTNVIIGGWELVSGRMGYIVTIPGGTEIAAYGYWVTNWTNHSLYNSTENITLYNATGTEVDKTLTADDNYNNDSCWARFPNGVDTDSDSDWSFMVSTPGALNERFELPFSVIPPGTTYIMNITVDTVIPANVGENATIVFFDETAVIDTETYYVTTMTKPVGGGKLYLGVDYTTENYTMKRTVEKNVSGVEAANLTFDPAYVMLDYPLWVEKTWTTTTNVTGMLLNETGAEIPINTIAVVSGEVTDEVDLTVPYGTIHCLVVEVNVSLQYPPISFLTRYWMSDHEMALMPKYQSHVSGSLVEELELISVTIPDTTPPEIFNLQPADGSFINDTTPTISANYSDLGTGINESSVEIVVDGTDVTLDTNTTVTATGVSYIADLSEGLHTVTVNVSDNATTPNTNSTSWAFTVDITKPTIEFIAPTPGNNTEVTDNYVEVVVNVTDNFDLTHAVGILWWNETETEPMTKTLYAADEGKFNYTMTDLANGNYTYKVYANDTAGNMNVSETRVVTVESAIELMEGDVTMDMHVTMADAMFIAQYNAGIRSLNASQLKCADTTDEGDVTMADAMHIAQWKADPDGTLGVLYKPLWESPADDDMLEPVDT